MTPLGTQGSWNMTSHQSPPITPCRYSKCCFDGVSTKTLLMKSLQLRLLTTWHWHDSGTDFGGVHIAEGSFVISPHSCWPGEVASIRLALFAWELSARLSKLRKRWAKLRFSFGENRTDKAAHICHFKKVKKKKKQRISWSWPGLLSVDHGPVYPRHGCNSCILLLSWSILRSHSFTGLH